MRTICLLNTEFNANNQWIGRMMMSMAEEQFLLTAEQYGSQKNHCSAIEALNKWLNFYLFRNTKQSGILISNNASKRYDCIVHSVAILAIQCKGISYNAARLLFLPLQKM